MPHFTTIAGILKEVLKARGLGSGDALAKLRGKWTAAVGGKIAQHAQPQMIRDGRLTLTVDSPAWMSQLNMLSPQIIEKINAVLDDGAVRELKFCLGAPLRNEKEKKAAPIKKRELSLEEKDAIESAAAKIQDKELRSSAKKLLSKSCKRVK
jgi:predicted nucleic acid-binding Zn ribbon protein